MVAAVVAGRAAVPVNARWRQYNHPVSPWVSSGCARRLRPVVVFRQDPREGRPVRRGRAARRHHRRRPGGAVRRGSGGNAGAGSVWALPGTATQVTGKGSVSLGAGTLGTVAAKAALGAAFDRR